MSDDELPAMSAAEREVMKVLWAHGPLQTKDVICRLEDRYHKWARTTVITLLQRLEQKGYIQSDKSGFAFIYEAAVTIEQVMHGRVAEIAEELCEGNAVPLLLAFTQRHALSKAEIARFRNLLDELAPAKRGEETKK